MTKIDTIRFLKREELDILKYDELIQRSEAVSIYCYSWYLDAVSDNWGAMVLADYTAVLPISYTVKMGQSILYQPFFTREIAVFPTAELELFRFMLEAIPPHFKKIDLGSQLKVDVLNLNRKGVVFQELALEASYESIYSAYSTNTRRLLKKATNAKATIEEIKDVERFITFFKTHTGERVNYSAYNYEKLKMLITVLLEKGIGKIVQVSVKGEVVAQGVYLFQNHRVTYLKGTTNAVGKKIGAMFLLMDEIIKQNAGQAKTFDFGGSKIDSIAAFYKKFGAKDAVYYLYSKNEHPWWLKKGKKVMDLLKK